VYFSDDSLALAHRKASVPGVRSYPPCPYSHSTTASVCHPKTLLEIDMVLSKNSDSFPSNSHVSATFSILLRFGEFWNPTNSEKFNVDGSLMGRTKLDKSVW